MRVFITGGAGFIGSHLADALVARGDAVTILDNMSTGSASNIAHLEGKIEIIKGDIRDAATVEKAMANADLVLHMAAALGVNTILESPIESVSTNFTGSEVVLQAATKLNKRIIIASTSEIYGKNPKQPLNELDDRVVGTPQKIRWTYSDAKALEEAIAHALFLTKGLKVTTVRLFNTVGPRQTGRYGMVVPRFVQAALKNEPISIYGGGEQTRSFCYVSDLIEGIYKVLMLDKNPQSPINLGNPNEFRVVELANTIKELTGSKSEIMNYPLPEDDPKQRCPDISLARNSLNWEPTVGLVEGLEKTIEYFKQVLK